MMSKTTSVHRSIMIDTTFLFDQYGIRGIGRYGKEVLKLLIPIIVKDPHWKLHLLGFSDIEHNLVEIGLSNLSVEEYKKNIEFHSIGTANKSDTTNYEKWFEVFQPIIDTVRPSVYFAVHFERGLPTLPSKRGAIHFEPQTIVTVHDAIPFQTNVFSAKSPIHNYFKKRFYLKMWNGVKRADKIMTHSAYSKDTIVQLGGVDPEKITVIPLGVDKKFFRDTKIYDEQDTKTILESYRLQKEDYLFYDSGIEANKGVYELFDMLSYLFSYKQIKIGKRLVMVGGHFKKGIGETILPNTKEAKLLLKYAKQKEVLKYLQSTGRIPDKELIVLLHNAKAHINFSELEGFNLGPIQAMAGEVPTIVANSSCNPEVTKGKAMLVDISTSKQTARDIKNFLEDSKAIQKQVKEALEVAKEYNWDATVGQIWHNINTL